MTTIVEPPKWQPPEADPLEGMVRYKDIWVDEKLTDAEKEKFYQDFIAARPKARKKLPLFIGVAAAVALGLVGLYAHYQLGLF
jgi:hypothetical protein